MNKEQPAYSRDSFDKAAKATLDAGDKLLEAVEKHGEGVALQMHGAEYRKARQLKSDLLDQAQSEAYAEEAARRRLELAKDAERQAEEDRAKAEKVLAQLQGGPVLQPDRISDRAQADRAVENPSVTSDDKSSENWVPCRFCRFKNPIDSNFCGECGQQLKDRIETAPMKSTPEIPATKRESVEQVTTADSESAEKQGNPEAEDDKEKVYREIKRGVVKETIASVPAGEHWEIDAVRNAVLNVEPGAKVTVKGSIEGSPVSIEGDGRLIIEGDLIDSPVGKGKNATFEVKGKTKDSLITQY